MNISRSSPLEGEHTPTIIQLILSTDLAVIQLKDSHLILHISQQDGGRQKLIFEWYSFEDFAEIEEDEGIIFRKWQGAEQ